MSWFSVCIYQAKCYELGNASDPINKIISEVLYKLSSQTKLDSDLTIMGFSCVWTEKYSWENF